MTAYLKYFWTICVNWNIRLAAFVLLHEIKGARKYGIDTMEMDDLEEHAVEGKNKKYASIYQASSYYLLEKAFNFLEQEEISGSLVDFGAGKGRVLTVAAHHGYKRIKGIEFAPGLCSEAWQNVQKILPQFPDTEIAVLCMDAADYAVENSDTVFFLFNPFEEPVMLQVLKNMLQSVRDEPRKIYVVYLNPVCEELFLSAGFVKEYYVVKFKYLEMSIYSFEPYEVD